MPLNDQFLHHIIQQEHRFAVTMALQNAWHTVALSSISESKPLHMAFYLRIQVLWGKNGVIGKEMKSS